jgi:hypothetical protein
MSSIWESADFKVLIVQCIIIWATLLTAIIKCAKYKGDREELHGASAKGKEKYAATRMASKPTAPMLSFVTVDEIYNMSLEVLQSVPKEQMEQLPPDKRAIVKRRVNELIQAERIKQNK